MEVAIAIYCPGGLWISFRSPTLVETKVIYTTQECHSTILTFKGDSFLQSGIFRCHLIPFLQIPRCSGGEVVVSIEKLQQRTGLLEKRSANTKLSCTCHNCILGMVQWTNSAVYSYIYTFYTLGYRVANQFWSTRRLIHILKNKGRAGYEGLKKRGCTVESDLATLELSCAAQFRWGRSTRSNNLWLAKDAVDRLVNATLVGVLRTHWWNVDGMGPWNSYVSYVSMGFENHYFHLPTLIRPFMLGGSSNRWLTTPHD